MFVSDEARFSIINAQRGNYNLLRLLLSQGIVSQSSIYIYIYIKPGSWKKTGAVVSSISTEEAKDLWRTDPTRRPALPNWRRGVEGP